MEQVRSARGRPSQVSGGLLQQFDRELMRTMMGEVYHQSFAFLSSSASRRRARSGVHEICKESRRRISERRTAVASGGRSTQHRRRPKFSGQCVEWRRNAVFVASSSGD